MNVDPGTAAGSIEWQGKTYYFCSVTCQRQFQQSPERFARP
jgi:Cu+-exporting ATPase